MTLFNKKQGWIFEVVRFFTLCLITSNIFLIPMIRPGGCLAGNIGETDGNCKDDYTVFFKNTNPLKDQYLWSKKAYHFFKGRHFDAYLWIYNGRNTLAIIDLARALPELVRSERAACIALEIYFIEMLHENGLMNKNLEVVARKNKKVSFQYKMVLESGYEKWWDRKMWEIKVGQLLTKNGYLIPHLYEKPFEHAISIDFPPWNDAKKILKLISHSSLAPVKRYRLYEEDMVSEDPYYLHDIIKTKKGFTIEIFKPGKWQLGFKNEGNFEIRVTNPFGRCFHCAFRQPVEREIKKTFPDDFFTRAEQYVDGKYLIRAYIDGNRIMDEVLTISGEKIMVNQQADTPIYFSDDEFAIFNQDLSE